MALGSGVIPWSKCSKCGTTSLAIGKCSECGLSHSEARVAMDPTLCLCGATKCEPLDGTTGWNTIHDKGASCLTNQRSKA